jgi:hypothetical protein
MFKPTERNEIRSNIIRQAKADIRIGGGAITGSASVGKEDEWSLYSIINLSPLGFNITQIGTRKSGPACLQN